jgi:hypothetical protein
MKILCSASLNSTRSIFMCLIIDHFAPEFTHSQFHPFMKSSTHSPVQKLLTHEFILLCAVTLFIKYIGYTLHYSLTQSLDISYINYFFFHTFTNSFFNLSFIRLSINPLLSYKLIITSFIYNCYLIFVLSTLFIFNRSFFMSGELHFN